MIIITLVIDKCSLVNLYSNIRSLVINTLQIDIFRIFNINKK
jgi:hypothetical protein